MNKAIYIAIAIGLLGCSKAQQKSEAELKAEIIKAETDFKNMAQQKGIAEAFATFADSNAVIKGRNDTLIIGKENIRKYFTPKGDAAPTVTWAADFVEVSKDGTLGYTYGKYTWTTKDSTGKATDYKGVFHTVWKRQSDGSWKYVWD